MELLTLSADEYKKPTQEWPARVIRSESGTNGVQADKFGKVPNLQHLTTVCKCDLKPRSQDVRVAQFPTEDATVP